MILYEFFFGPMPNTPGYGPTLYDRLVLQIREEDEELLLILEQILGRIG